MDPVFEEYILHVKNEEDIFAKAKLIHVIHKDKGFTLKQIAQGLGYSSVYVCNILRLRKLPDLVQDGYYAQQISPTHLFILARLKDHESMIRMYEEVLKGGHSTVWLENAVREKLHNISSDGQYADDVTTRGIIEKFQHGDDSIRVKVIQTRIRAKVIIETEGNVDKTNAFLKKILES